MALFVSAVFLSWGALIKSVGTSRLFAASLYAKRDNKMSRSIHEPWNKLKKENPTKGEFDKMSLDDSTLKQLLKKSHIKKIHYLKEKNTELS